MSSQTSTFVKKLASNDRNTREAAFEALQNYLRSKSTAKLTLLEMEKLWKGLYFAMWFCDKPLPQQTLAQALAELYSDVIPDATYCAFHEAFWVIIIKEWPSIDQWRIDKYLLLIRRVLRQNFVRLQKHGWKPKQVEEFTSVLEKHVLSGDRSVSVALPYHLIDIYMEEIETVLFANLQEDEEELETEQDSDERTAKYKQIFAKKLEIVSQTPVKDLISPFEKLSKSALLKTLREKCKDEVLNDERLKDWGVFETESDEDSDEDDKKDDDDDDDEWKGF